MRNLIRGFVLALALSLAGSGGAADPAPRIGKPRPAPPANPNGSPLPPAALDNSLVIGGDDLRARKSDTRMTVEVHVNGRGPYHFVVDSGADTSVVGVGIARDLALPLGTPAILNGTTDRAIVDRVRVDQLLLGQTTFGNLELPALREYDLGGQGMIGIDALVNQRLMMDFEKHVIKVEDARLPEQHLQGEIVIVARRRRGQLILTHVTAVGFPLDAVIDTGSEVTIGNLALRDKLIRGNRDKFTSVQATGVTGVSMDLQLARIAELKLGSVTLRNVPIAFADVPPFALFGMAKQPALLLGTDLLANFRRVSLDFRARKVRFQLKRCGTYDVSVTTDPNASFMRMSTLDDGVCLR